MFFSEIHVAMKTNIPVASREYLPPNIVKFNAYAIHGKNWGESKPAGENKLYEALYPIDAAATGKTGPDFHYLPAFQPINLTQIGYEEVQSYSNIWKTAISQGDHHFT